MKRLFLFLVSALQLVFLQAQNKYEKEPFLTRALTNESIKEVEVQTSGGSISVEGVSSNARIEVYVSSNNDKDNLSKEEIQKRLDEKYDLNIGVSNNKLTATSKPKEKIRDWKTALSISFKIYVPQNVSTQLTTSGGSIHLTRLSGSQEFTTSGGSLHLDGLSGKVNGRTSGGSIHLENSKDDIDLVTSGGSIHAKNTEGNIRLSTSGGSLELKGLKGTIKASTSGGSVLGKEIQGELIATTSGGSIQFADLACSLQTATSGGNIDVSFKELGSYVKISNSAGNIDLELPRSKGLDLKLSANRIKTDHFENFNGKVEDERVEGKLNGGGIPVTVMAGSGRINLVLK
jgi:hypothetical protein